MARVPYINTGAPVDFSAPFANAVSEHNKRKQNEIKNAQDEADHLLDRDKHLLNTTIADDNRIHNRESRELNAKNYGLAAAKNNREQKIYDAEMERRKVLGDLVVTPTIENLGHNVQKVWGDANKELDALEADYASGSETLKRQRGFFTEDGKELTDIGRAAFDERLASIKPEAGTDYTSAINKELKTTWEAANNSDYLTAQRAFIDKRREAIGNAKDSAVSNMTSEEFVATAQKQLFGIGFKEAYSQEITERLLNRAKAQGYRPRDEIVEEGKKAAKAAYNSKVKQAELIGKFYKQEEAGKSKYSSNGSSAYKIRNTFEEFLETLDQWGTDEKDSLRTLVERMAIDPEAQAAGVKDYHIMQAAMHNVYNGIWSDWGFRDLENIKDLKDEVIASAKSLSGYEKQAISNSTRPKKEDFDPGVFREPLDSAILANRFTKHLVKMRAGKGRDAPQPIASLGALNIQKPIIPLETPSVQPEDVVVTTTPKTSTRWQTLNNRYHRRKKGVNPNQSLNYTVGSSDSLQPQEISKPAQPMYLPKAGLSIKEFVNSYKKSHSDREDNYIAGLVGNKELINKNKNDFSFSEFFDEYRKSYKERRNTYRGLPTTPEPKVVDTPRSVYSNSYDKNKYTTRNPIEIPGPDVPEKVEGLNPVDFTKLTPNELRILQNTNDSGKMLAVLISKGYNKEEAIRLVKLLNK